MKMNFADILASTLHDTKNSLSILYNSLEEVINHCQGMDCSKNQDLYTLQYEIKRLNNCLIRLLTLYRADKSPLTLNIDYNNVCDFIEDTVLQNQPLLNSRDIRIELDCPEDLFWAFDRNLLAGVLDNVINNAFRYTKDCITISARQVNGDLVILIEDDGTGYPEYMFLDGSQDPFFKKDIDFFTGSTGLGLYFSLMVAQAHTNKDRKGYISIANGGQYGGGVFSIGIP